jgi:hypothetical protein
VCGGDDMNHNVITISLDFQNKYWRVDFHPGLYEGSSDPNTVTYRQVMTMKGRFPEFPHVPSRDELIFHIWKEVSWAINNKLHCDLIDESK